MPEWIQALIPTRTKDMRYRYGLELEEYISFLLRQEGRCRICESRFQAPKNLPVIDHCHEEGHVRGLLCHNCNRGLGSLGESVPILKQSINYLKETRMAKPQSQADAVLSYLQRRKHITQATATSVLAVSRLAAVILRLKKRGHNINTRMIDGVKGRYAEYSLA